MNLNRPLIATAIIALLIGVGIAIVAKEYLFPTTGTVTNVQLTFTWTLDDTPVTSIDWGTVDNSTEYVMNPINITNTSNVPVNITLSTANEVGIISLSLTWNHTDTTLAIDESVIIELYQNVTATGAYSYDTIIGGIEA